jgi:26S proteasome regulatory subunit N1
MYSIANYVPEPDDTKVLQIVLHIYKDRKKLPDALRIAMRLNNIDTIKETFESCTDEYVFL